MRRALVIAGIAAAAISGAALSQDEASQTDENGFLANLLQNTLSAPGRQISLSGVEGLLSSQATIAQITVSDDAGPWIEIDNVTLDWNRARLLLGRVDVNVLSAEAVSWTRMGEAPPSTGVALPEAEAQPFSLPELPVSIEVDEIRVDRISLAEAIAGQAAELSLEGGLTLAGGALSARVDLDRLDGAGGTIDLTTSFDNEGRRLDLDLRAEEPAGGLVASLLDIEGQPPLSLRIAGGGPLENLDIDALLDVDGERTVSGRVTLRADPEGLRFGADLSGQISRLLPSPYRPFFEGETTLSADGVSLEAGGIRLDTAQVATAELDLRGRAETGPDGFPRSLDISGSFGDPAGPAVVLPVPGAQTSLTSAQLRLNYGDARSWTGLLVLDRLGLEDLEIEDLTLSMGGEATDLADPDRRSVTLALDALATGLWSPDRELAEALGSRVAVSADAELEPGGTLDLRDLELTARGLSLAASGQVADMEFSGDIVASIDDLDALSAFAGRPLGGSLDLSAVGSVSPLAGGFDLDVEGTARAIVVGDPRLDALLAGQTTLSGGAVRDEQGFRTEGLRLQNPQLQVSSTGVYSQSRTDIGLQAALTDLALIDPRLSGAVTLDASARGQGRQIDLSADASIPDGQLLDRSISGLDLSFDGRLDGTDLTGQIDGGGQLDALVIDLQGALGLTSEGRSLRNLEAAIGGNRLTGDILMRPDGLLDGEVSLDAPDLASIGALGLIEADGRASADLRLSHEDGAQNVAIAAEATDASIAGNSIGALEADLTIADAFSLPLPEGTLSASDVAAGPVAISSVTIDARRPGDDATQVSAQARLPIGTLIDASAGLERTADGFTATLSDLSIRQGEQAATLLEPATVTLSGGNVELTPLELDLGTGRLAAEGRFGEEISLDLDLDAVPLSLANTIRPELGLTGTLTGDATVSGPRANPDITFDLAGEGLGATALRDAGLPVIAVNARGNTDADGVALDAEVSAAGGLSATAKGNVPLGDGELDLAVNLDSFPLALVDPLAGRPGLTGTINGTANVTGSLADPSADFSLAATGVGASVLTENGIPPINASAAGSFAGMTLVIDRAEAGGAPGLQITASGRVPLAGNGLNVTVDGTVPLALADPILEQRSAQASGTVRINATARGSLSQPLLGGRANLSNGTIVDPGTNVRLENVGVDAALDGQTVALNSVSADVPGGGRITAGGTFSLDAAAGFPADLAIRMDNVRYTDGAFVTTEFSGALDVNGPVSGGGGTLSGRIDLAKTEISISEGLGGNAAAALAQVRHVRPPPRVVETLRRADIGEPTLPQTSGRSGLNLDILVSAPNQIFVRGRGLDAELGGEVRITGPTTDIRPVGEFELRRGRLIVLTQRIDLTQGELTLLGDLDPLILFEARTESDGVTAIVRVEGRASDPEITFTSEPPLPEDEVLARVLFNTNLSDLSPFQAAQLAAAAAELAGTGGPGVLSQLRDSIGLADLDIVTEESGATALRAGRYLSEDVYVDVLTGSDGVSRAEIVYEINERITARGTFGTDGNSVFGIFFERDY